ncbi:Dipeptidyl-peptidase 5 [Tilletia horrida]|uniref:Dipeptidyl-peptidase V n=1 Tax=Tilletia horrida TaxID=155126 RepID=A0AAN6GAC0_9BASI|nr:Dipeptidyl-peptidase 5 [Tilletia horrida]
MRFPAALAAIATATAASAAAASLSPLTPRQLIEAPQVAAGIVSPNGLHALVGVSEHDLGSPAKVTTRKTIYHLGLPAHIAGRRSGSKDKDKDKDKDGPALAKPQPLVHNVTEAVFIGDDEAVWLHQGTLYYKNVSQPNLEPFLPGTPVGAFPDGVEVTTLKAVSVSDKKRTLVFSAEVYDDGKLEAVKDHDESDVEQEWERVRAYDSTFVRHWDRFIKSNKRSQLFAIDLERKSDANGKGWQFSSDGFRNLLQGTKLETPVPPFGGAEDYDVNKDHVVFTSRDPEGNAAWYTKQGIYLAPLAGGKAPKKLTTGDHGITASPRISPDGKTVVWLQMGKNGFESDKRVLHFHDLASGKTRSVFPEWTYSAKAINFAPNGKELHLLVEHQQKDKLFVVALKQAKTSSSSSGDGDRILSPVDSEPQELISSVSVKASQPVIHGGALITASSHYSTAELYWLAPTGGSKLVQLTTFGKDSAALSKVDFGPEPEEIQWAGAKGRTAHGWILKPPGFKASKKYPLAVLIHGGPEGAWTNAWSVRWNPAVFAAAGFVVFTPNPAGSTSFGQDYQEEILGSWGEKPYLDIISGVHHVLRVVDGVDKERVVAAGASYGGFMINWLQGHNNDKLFKGLVCHDGVFNTLATFYSTDELWFPEAEFGGVPWDVPANYARFNPQAHVANWNTPQLIIHGGRDYRLTESEGLSAFNALQRRGVPSRLLFFPEENHWVLEPRNSLRWHQEVIGWLSKYANATVPSSVAEGQETISGPASNVGSEPMLTFQHGN